MKSEIKPPRLFLNFLRWFCHPRLLDRIEGDLLEVYFEQLERSGKRKADAKFIIDVILLFRPSIIRPMKPYQNFNRGMVNNYLTVAWRNIVRDKAFSLINIGGLSLGVTCSLLIFLWILDELNVDKFNSKPDVYSVYEKVFSEGKVDAGPWTPGVLAAELKERLPEIKYASGVWRYSDDALFTVDGEKLGYRGVAADSDFFNIFNYRLLRGNAATALREPNSLAISRKMAEGFFGSTQAAYGNTVRMNNRKDLKITAVFEDLPDNASQKFDFVNNYDDLLEDIAWLKIWIYRGVFTYIQLHPGADAGMVETKIKDFLAPFMTANSGEGYRTELGLQPYDEMYLNSDFKNGIPDGGRIEYVRLFALTAIFITLIACINFTNLSTARSVKRGKEVGVRKTMGAFKGYLITQFIGEAMLLTFMAVMLAIGLVALLLPMFNVLTVKHIVLPLANLQFWGGVAAMILVMGLVAGAYPAFYLSSLNSIKILKGSLKADPGASFFRKGLVVFQFILVIAFIAGTITISRQVRYMQSKDPGFDRESLLYIPLQGDLASKYQVFRDELLRSPGIQNVTRSTNQPSDINTHEYDLSWEGKSQDERIVAIHNGIGYDFIPMMNIPVLQGRNFSREFISDSNAFIINETALKTIGYDDPIGKRIRFLGREGPIIGLVKDFHLKSLRDRIMPLVMYLGEEIHWGFVLVKTRRGETQAAISSVENVFKQLEPEFLPRYYFADDAFQKLYNSEQTVNKLSTTFTVLAVVISCLGLLGLTMFTVEQRRKEIGVRKVIGATTLNIVAMLSNDVVRLVLIAALVATPVAWYAMDKWLSQFAYRVNAGWWPFIGPTTITLLIALVTTSFQAVKAAIANPVRSLRSE